MSYISEDWAQKRRLEQEKHDNLLKFFTKKAFPCPHCERPIIRPEGQSGYRLDAKDAQATSRGEWIPATDRDGRIYLEFNPKTKKTGFTPHVCMGTTHHLEE